MLVKKVKFPPMCCLFKKGIRTREWEEILKITQPHPSVMLMKKQRPRKQKGHNRRIDLTPTCCWVINVIIAFKNIEQQISVGRGRDVGEQEEM